MGLVNIFFRSKERTWTEVVRERVYWEENVGLGEDGEDYLLRSFIICMFAKCRKEYCVGEECFTSGRNEKCIQNIGRNTRREEINWETEARWMAGCHLIVFQKSCVMDGLYWFSCLSVMSNGGPYFLTSWVATNFSRNIPRHGIVWCLFKALLGSKYLGS
jgi:hypothetical protein